MLRISSITPLISHGSKVIKLKGSVVHPLELSAALFLLYVRYTADMLKQMLVDHTDFTYFFHRSIPPKAR